jgi:RimJ/RimL family protein N-acetyltransferase
VPDFSPAVFETKRLSLRRLTDGDFDELHAMFNDPLVMRHYPGLKHRAETAEWLGWQRKSYEIHGHGLWAVELRASGEFVGQVGLLAQTVDGAGETEIGYLLKSAHWHKGYATEAAIACRDYGFDVLGRPHLISLIRPANAPSRAVAERVGMTVWKSVERRGWEHLVYRIRREKAATSEETLPH